jgi:dATP pyrophosphohydrolase
MPRAPFQVLVLPWRRNGDGGVEYLIARRADIGIWQAISGGGENDETPLAAAKREAYEEAGIPPDCTFLPLDATTSIPAHVFPTGLHWGDDVYVIPEHAYGVDVTGRSLLMSYEHTDMRWLSLADASTLLQFDSNRIALWELNQRIHNLGPRGVMLG